MNDLQKWRDLIVEVTKGQTALNQTLTRGAPGLEKEEDLFNRSDSYSNVTTVADLIMVLQTEIDKALPLVQKDTQDRRTLALLQQLNRQNLKRIASQLYGLAKMPRPENPEEEK